MARYSVQPRSGIFLKDYEFLSFARIMGKSVGKNISKNVSGKSSQKRFDHTKQTATDALKAVSKRPIQKTAETTGQISNSPIGNEIADRIPKVSNTSPKNNSEENIEHGR